MILTATNLEAFARTVPSKAELDAAVNLLRRIRLQRWPLYGRSVRFRLDGKPQRQERHKTRIITKRNGEQFVSVYDPPKSRKNKEVISSIAHDAMFRSDFPAFRGPIQCFIRGVFPCPKTAKRKTMDVPRIWYPSSPDADNMAKLILDACNKITMKDDAQICDLRVLKLRAAQDEQPFTDVRFTELEGIS